MRGNEQPGDSGGGQLRFGSVADVGRKSHGASQVNRIALPINDPSAKHPLLPAAETLDKRTILLPLNLP